MEKKYDITEKYLQVNGTILHQIVALKDFGNIKKGELGGFIRSEENLSQKGDCWVFDNAKIYDNAMIYGNASVCDNARVYNNARVYGFADIFGKTKISDGANINSTNKYITISPIGSRDDTTTFYLTKDNHIRVNCGCFNGTIDELAQAVEIKHRNNKLYETQYLSAIEYAQKVFNVMKEENEYYG